MKPYSRQVLRDMFDGHTVSPVLPYKSLDADRETVQLVTEGNGRISLSGVQPKFSMVADHGVLRLTRPQEQGQYILKPAPTALFILDREYCPANEHLTMMLARKVYGIDTAPCCLCEFGNGQIAYLTRRFDVRPDGGKYAQEDFAQLAGLSKEKDGVDYKYNIFSYEDCASLLGKYVRAVSVNLLKFFRLVVFNYLILNDDAHLKNFSIIENLPGEYTLAPAYDLMNTSLHLAQPSIFALKKGLFKEGMVIDDTHSVSRESFNDFGLRIGLPNKLVDRELDKMSKVFPEAEAMIADSLLSDRLKNDYLLSYQYRCFTLAK